MFVNAVDVIHHSGGIVAYSPGVEENLAARDNIVVANLTPEALIAFKEKVYEEFLATIFVLHSDRTRFGVYIESLENDYLQGEDKYPRTLDDAHNLLANWKQEQVTKMPHIAGSGISFTNVGDEVKDAVADVTKELSDVALVNDGKHRPPNKNSNVTCFKCGENGHYAPECIMIAKLLTGKNIKREHRYSWIP
eukprot:scaffold26100_cov31-Attheya_sp.AAC.4